MNGKSYPLRCRIKAEGAVTRLDILDDIGADPWFGGGISAADVAGQLTGARGPLDVHISSAGGMVDQGLAIYNALASYPGPVTTYNDGLAASIASVIMQAGSRRVMSPVSAMMIHDAWGAATGDAADMAAMAEALSKNSDIIARAYADRAGGTVAQWREVMQATKWYDADEALAAGLVDEVAGGSRPAAPVDLELIAASAPARIMARLRAAAAPPHDPFTGSHSHAHPAMGSQGGDDGHEHEHSHDGDADHGHHAQDRAPKPSAAAPGAETPVCRTCDGRGTVPHPATGQKTLQCPGCQGTGLYDPPDEGDETQDRAPRLARDSGGRVLGLESMPLADKALPVHHTATEDTAWNGPAAVKAMPNDDTVLEYCFAWQSDEAASVPHREGDDDADDQKSSYKFPHHERKGGPANLHACNNGLSRLPGADIPDGDRAGVEAHLRAHLKDAGQGNDSADNHAHSTVFGQRLKEMRAALPALRGAGE